MDAIFPKCRLWIRDCHRHWNLLAADLNHVDILADIPVALHFRAKPSFDAIVRRVVAADAQAVLFIGSGTAVVEGIQALLNGEPRDLLEVPLDMSRVTPFQRDVYAVARAIPPGETLTYGEIAARRTSSRVSSAA